MVLEYQIVQAKLKEFKRQYVDHAARKLRLIVDMTSANCSHQVLNLNWFTCYNTQVHLL